MTYKMGIANCDKCNSALTDGGNIYCEDCFNILKQAIAWYANENKRLEAENTNFKDNVDALMQQRDGLKQEVKELSVDIEEIKKEGGKNDKERK